MAGYSLDFVGVRSAAVRALGAVLGLAATVFDCRYIL